MPWIDLKSALKSEAGFLEFIRSSYRHGTVVALCAGAIGILNRRLEAAVARKDRDGQRYLYTQIEVLRSEMHDALVELNRELEENGKGARSWKLKTEWDRRRKEIKLLSDLQFRSAIYKCIRDVLGEGFMPELEKWMTLNTRIPHFRKLRDRSRDSKPSLKLQLLPGRKFRPERTPHRSTVSSEPRA